MSSVLRKLLCTALKRTSAGICSRHTCSAYADPISIDRAMLPFMAKEIAFCHQVSAYSNLPVLFFWTTAY